MRIPSVIKIGGHQVEVGRHPRKENDSAGYYDIRFDRISMMEEELSESRSSEILLHEIIEAVKYKYGLELEHRELVILSEALFQIMRDNGINFSDKEQY